MALFGRTRKDGVPADWRRSLGRLVASLGPLHAAVVDHVVTGSDPGVLSQLPGRPLLYGLVDRNIVSSQQGHPDGARVLAGFADVEPEVMHRWVRVLEAAATGNPGAHQRWYAAMAPVRGREWPELVLRHANQAIPAGQPLPFTLADLVRVLELDGLTALDLVVALLDVSGARRWAGDGGRPALFRLPGFAALLVEHHALVTDAAGPGPVERRVAALGLLAVLDGPDLVVFADAVVGGLVANATDVRRAATAVLDALDRADPVVVGGALQRTATSGKPDERGRALGLLRERVIDEDGRTWVLETAAADRAASVRGLVDAWRAVEATPEPEAPHLPALAPVDWAVPRAAAEDAARAVMDELTEIASMSRHAPRPSRRLQTRLADLLSDTRPVTGRADDFVDYLRSSLVRGSSVARATAVLGPAGTVQLLRACGQLDDTVNYDAWAEPFEQLHRETRGCGLAELQQLVDGVGVDGFELLWKGYRHPEVALAREWPADDVWPFVLRNLDAILAEGPPTDTFYHDPAAYFRALGLVPAPPARLLDHLFSLAVGSQRGVRPLAQQALVDEPSRTPRAAAALTDGRGEVRTLAARWLARIADPAALPALQAAWTKEKNDVVRGALLDALEALGEPVADYLDINATAAQAAKVVARGLPAALAWLAPDAVPEVRWADGGPVPRAIVPWLAANAVKARSPEPDALLRRYAGLIDPADRERLGAHLLAAWMAEDTRPIPLADAEQQAQQWAVSEQRWAAQDPQSPYHGKSVAEIAAMLLPQVARQPAGSAIASKGLLAVVAATAGRDVVAPTERYLKEWYGQRAAQGKALIAMLAWVDDPAATQLMLSVGSRFRTKSFQQEATAQAQALAERKGWTLDELADRTIPTAGFESTPDGAVLELSYGLRVFTARLLPDLSVVLHDPDGKTLKALPTPRQSDDADLARDAKKAFTAAKKDVKATAKQQAERLYEALCTERDWPADDWRRYLVDHPVVGPAVRRLVWVDTDTGASFRPLDDGSLTDVDDVEVVLDPGHRVRLAHDSLLPPDVVRRWGEHLADYEIDPLFQQLGKGVYELPDERRAATAVTDLEGHVLEAFALRGRALRSGYTRGPAEDGGWFSGYRKRFPTLGLVAQVGFTGNGLPEENRTVALTELSFLRELPQGRQVVVALGDVPAVLLSEIVGDLHLFAADGTGFDPDWQRTTEYR